MLSLVRMIQLWGTQGAQQNDTILKAIKEKVRRIHLFGL